MADITLDGTFYNRGITGDPIVIISALDEGLLKKWWAENKIFTQLFEHRDPKSDIDRPAIYVAKSVGNQLSEGTLVRITIDVRPEKRGTGIQVVDVVDATIQN